MKTLALRIYLAVVTVLLIFALVSGWMTQRHMEHERSEVQSQTAWNERVVAWGELIEHNLPSVQQSEAEQARVFLEWAERLRLPMALDDASGRRIATSSVMRRWQDRPETVMAVQTVRLSDGRSLVLMRPQRGFMRDSGRFDGSPPDAGPAQGGPSWRGHDHPHGDERPPWLTPLEGLMPLWMVRGVPALILSLVLLFVAVALGAWPVANRLTRRLKALRDGVEAFGAGQLQQRVAVEGRDEVAELAHSFNDTAQRIEDLVNSNRNLLANASHELRSPLARLKMAVSIMGDMPPERAAQLRDEIHEDIRELDALVEEVLLASRLDNRGGIEHQPVDLLGLVTEEARRVGAHVAPVMAFDRPYLGDDRLLRRAVRNLLENARRYGGPDIELVLASSAQGVDIAVCDRGPGVPVDQRERIFEPFYRMPGHAEHAGGVGLGLSLVRQIASRHRGKVRCEAREGGGSRFVISLPAQTSPKP